MNRDTELCDSCGQPLPPSGVAGALRTAMHKAGMTQGALAVEIDVHRTTINHYLRGKAEPSLHRIALIEDACGLKRGQILRWAGYVDEGGAS